MHPPRVPPYQSVIALVVISAASAYFVTLARRRGHVIAQSWQRSAGDVHGTIVLADAAA
ncbi:MAG: hypothetical protein ACLQVI_27215 [Polyangiaceae bacterium]|jgi:hypothetical protein